MTGLTLTLLQVWVGIFGMIAAVASFRSGWKATALPPSTPEEKEKKENVEETPAKIAAYDVST